ncbi:MAG: adenylyltransferase/cytidyltransferase family protein [Candidatus Schekmanbacteria bacterium]|nr:adenylyltransferase/cytidyltransferase family protein [Candidatus Schekmanbacteria bacterium]
MSKEKIKTLSELEQIVASIRKDNKGSKNERKTIVLANGCFDILHVGHVRYLEGAKHEGDVLIVALNSDSSSRALKGEGRPTTTLSERMEIIAAFECVDYVTCFEETNVVCVLLSLKPDVHAKGTDYTVDTVPERETVKQYGGRIAIVGDEKNHSSTDILNTMRNL